MARTQTKRLIRATKATKLTLYSREDLEAMLPQVGTKMTRIPTALQSDGPYKNGNLQPCTVVAVNGPGLWFRVHYDRLGFCECIKVPDGLPELVGGRDQ